MPQAPRDVPKVDPDTQVQENPISTSTDESIGIIFCVWTIIPWHGHSYTRHPRDVLSIRKSNDMDEVRSNTAVNPFTAHSGGATTIIYGRTTRVYLPRIHVVGNRRKTLEGMKNTRKSGGERARKGDTSQVANAK